jgi:hypothetical protein
MADPVNPRATEFGNINRTLSPEFKTDWDAVRAKDAEIKSYIGTTDYSAQNQGANDLAKLQFALSLMGRGFASMGAAPQPGENALGAVGRTLVAPLAGDISTISGPLMQQRAATRLAEQQEDRQRKMAAYTAAESSAKERRDLAEKLLGPVPKPAAIAQGNRGWARRYENGKPVGPVVPLQYTFDPNTGAYTARTIGEGGPRAAVILSGENTTHIVTNEAGEMLGGAGSGKPLGTTPKELTVTEIDPVTKESTQKTIQAVLMQTAPGVFRWKEAGPDGKFVDERYQGPLWEATTDDKLYQSLRPVLDQALQSAVGRRTDIEPEVREKLGKQVLTQADLKRLAQLKEEDRTDAINSIINARAKNLTGVTPDDVVSVPSEVLQLDSRVRAMATVPEGSPSLTRAVVNPRILQPWTKGGKYIQLGTGSHGGFSQAVSSGDVLESRRNFSGIKKAFEQAYGGARDLGDAEERILLFSGLWKKLPGIAERQGAITLDDNKFRAAFDKATAQYNEAAKEFKPAADINIGKGAQAKNLRAALDEDKDALRDNVIMLRFKDRGGAWFSDGTWTSELRSGGFGELIEAWSGTDGKERAMPSGKWDDIAKPDSQLNAADLALKRRAFAFLKEKSASQNKKGASIGLDEFERAAEYLGALSRYKVRAFSMIEDSRPSDKDIEILLAAFVGNRDSDTTAFAKLHELQNRHVNSLSRNINRGLSLNAVFDPVFLADLDHTSRALQRSSVRDVDPQRGGRAAESAALFSRSSDTIRRAAEAASGRIIPGYRGGAISPMSGNVDEESTANLYRRVVSAAKEAYPDKTPQEAVTEFVREGLHLTRFLGVYGTSRTAAPAVRERDGSFTIR